MDIIEIQNSKTAPKESYESKESSNTRLFINFVSALLLVPIWTRKIGKNQFLVGK